MSRSTASASKLSAIAALFFACLASNVYAQSFQGSLRGEVRDTAAVIPGVTVTLINESTTVSRTTVSNQVGAYVFAAVAPGTYTVRANLAGFKTFERKGLAIGTQQFVTMDLVMEVGAIEESVSVTGEAPLIETSNASTGQVLTKETIDALPALNRNVYMSSAVTVPTVVASGDPYFSRMEDQTNGSLVSLGGGPRRANNYLLDGVSTTDLQNRTSVFVGSEAISEVKIQVHTYDAEMGRRAAECSTPPDDRAATPCTAVCSARHGRIRWPQPTSSQHAREERSSMGRIIVTGVDPSEDPSPATARSIGLHTRDIEPIPAPRLC